MLQERELPELGALEVRNRLGEMSMTDVALLVRPPSSRARSPCTTTRGSSRTSTGPDGDHIDLAAIDILRLRERGVPRYNEFRRLFHLQAGRHVRRADGQPGVGRGSCERVYGDVEKVDVMIGMYAEPKPKGFGFSDTAFRVFILMASRRIESDRFFTTDYRPEVYTQAGFDWVEENTMRTLLLRHFPELAPALEGVENPFAPWKAVGAKPGG